MIIQLNSRLILIEPQTYQKNGLKNSNVTNF